MQVFICWSGDASRILAEAVRKFLHRVNHAVEPFMSSEDISKGQGWSEALRAKLASTDFGVLCMTPENLTEAWIQFEAGALSKRMNEAGVSALLLNVTVPDLSGPLRIFQHTKLESKEVWQLVQAINNMMPTKLDEETLKASFDAHWPEFAQAVAAARAALKQRPQPTPKKRSTEEMFAEILETLNSLQRLQPAFVFSDPTSFMAPSADWQQTLKAMGLGNSPPGLRKLSDIANFGTPGSFTVSPNTGGVMFSPPTGGLMFPPPSGGVTFSPPAGGATLNLPASPPSAPEADPAAPPRSRTK
jgi:hypothetical protein